MASDLHCDSLWYGGDLITMREGKYHIITDGAIAVSEGRILWLGKREDLPAFQAAQTTDLKGGIITPGLIDCHTHLVFGGDRSAEFEQRLNGALPWQPLPIAG